MSGNPYEAPPALPPSPPPAVGVLSGSRYDLRSVAVYQKGVMLCILLYLLAVIGQFALPMELRPMLTLGFLAVGLIGAVFVVLLSIKVYGVGIGIVLGVLTFIPCLGLLALLRVNAKATSVLQQNGIKVGLLGANLSQI
ncbi:MAG: hypothetical protein AB7U73_23990 [Pirellulales bacterium]